MKDKIEKLIADWEGTTVGTIQTTAARTAAIISAFSVPEPVLEALARLGQAESEAEKLSEISRIRNELLQSRAIPDEAKSILADINVQQKQKEVSEMRTKDIFVVVRYLRSLLST